MIREFVLLFQEDVSWASITKYLGKDFSALDVSREEMTVRAEHGREDGECRIYVERKAGLYTSGDNRVRLVYDEGSMAVGGQNIKIREMHIHRFSGRYADCIKLASKLAQKYDVILESRTHEQRAADVMGGAEFGRAHMKEFYGQKVGDALNDLTWWHLCGISQAAGEFVLHADERLPIRRLRVEIRKLRAVFTVLNGVLLPEQTKWQARLKMLTDKLAMGRELDVALSNWRRTAAQRRRYNRTNDKLMSFMRKERASESVRLRELFQLKKFTPFLLDIMLWTLTDPVKEGKDEQFFGKIVERRFARWYKRMAALVAEYPTFGNDEKAHEVRIKGKATRYVMQSMSGQAYGDNTKVLRSLKRLLDGLGVLHDNYINEELAHAIAKKHKDDELIYQAGVFVGGERAQTAAVRRLLPGLWEKFSADWEKYFA